VSEGRLVIVPLTFASFAEQNIKPFARWDMAVWGHFRTSAQSLAMSAFTPNETDHRDRGWFALGKVLTGHPTHDTKGEGRSMQLQEQKISDGKVTSCEGRHARLIATLAGRKKEGRSPLIKISTDDSPDGIHSRDVHRGGGRRRPPRRYTGLVRTATARTADHCNALDVRRLETVPRGPAALLKRFPVESAAPPKVAQCEKCESKFHLVSPVKRSFPQP